MIHNTFFLHVEGSQPYARLITYIQDHSDAIGVRKRKLVLLCPGGGYEHTSDREAEAMALQFLAMGYHAAVLRYSVSPSRYPTALLELAKSVQIIREHSNEWNVDADKIVIQGCSAGGHLAVSYCIFWQEQIVSDALEIVDNKILRPNGMLLCYPVITSGEYGNKHSFENLLGDRYESLKDSLSLENYINADVPPAFIWHTFEDSCVPVENSLLLVAALRRKGISTEFHLYPRGDHGLSLANELTAFPDGYGIVPECASWITLAKTWLNNL